MELVDVIEQSREYGMAMMETITLYLSVVTAYLVSAYVAGKNLSPIQMTIVTGFFVVFALFFSFGTYTYIMNAHELSAQYSETYLGRYQSTGYVIVTAELLGILASLWFMYDAHRK